VDGDAERLVIDGACHGSQQAWRQLFDWHFDAVYRCCLTLTGGRRDQAEEVSQQVFVVAARRIRRFRPDQASFRAWLYGIAQNRHLALVARERRRRVREALPRQEEDGSDGRAEPQMVVHEVLARLPFEYRRVLEEKYLERLTLKEMAEAHGRSIEAIESLLRRARDRFAPIYESMQDER
jgi:RNA polymerase sigma-70 factor (ECF subfamily)